MGQQERNDYLQAKNKELEQRNSVLESSLRQIATICDPESVWAKSGTACEQIAIMIKEIL
jgi:hypothetical protein